MSHRLCFSLIDSLSVQLCRQYNQSVLFCFFIVSIEVFAATVRCAEPNRSKSLFCLHKFFPCFPYFFRTIQIVRMSACYRFVFVLPMCCMMTSWTGDYTIVIKAIVFPVESWTFFDLTFCVFFVHFNSIDKCMPHIGNKMNKPVNMNGMIHNWFEWKRM